MRRSSFSADALDSAWASVTGNLVSLSEQQFVDCGGSTSVSRHSAVLAGSTDGNDESSSWETLCSEECGDADAISSVFARAESSARRGASRALHRKARRIYNCQESCAQCPWDVSGGSSSPFTCELDSESLEA